MDKGKAVYVGRKETIERSFANSKELRYHCMRGSVRAIFIDRNGTEYKKDSYPAK